jgi:hypothetical protein
MVWYFHLCCLCPVSPRVSHNRLNKYLLMHVTKYLASKQSQWVYSVQPNSSPLLLNNLTGNGHSKKPKSSACVYIHTFNTPVSRTNHVRINDFKKQRASQNHWQAVTSGPYHGSNSTLLPITWQCIFYTVSEDLSGFGGLVVSMLASGTWVCGFAVRFFWVKKSSACLPSEGK